MKIRCDALPARQIDQPAAAAGDSVEQFGIDYAVIGESVFVAKEDFESLIEANHGLRAGVQDLEEQVAKLRSGPVLARLGGGCLGVAFTLLMGTLRG